jgi:hypothetical protein
VKTNPKAFWKYANSRLKTRMRIDNIDREDGTRATTNREKAEEFNKFISSVFTDEDLEEIRSPETTFTGTPLEDVHITPDIIRQKLKKLKMCISPGPDGWYPRVLVELADQLCQPLSILFRSRSTQVFLPTYGNWGTSSQSIRRAVAGKRATTQCPSPRL